MSAPYDPINPEQPSSQGDPESGQPPYGQPPPGHPPYGQPQYGQPQYGQPPYAQPQYGQPPPYGQPYGQAPGYPQGAYAQGYAPQPQYAGWWIRVLASLIDSLIVIPLYVLGVVVLNNSSDVNNEPSGPAILIFVALLGAALVLNGWNRWFRAGRTGQSLGKTAMGIYLVAEATGQPIGAGRAFVRDLAHIFDAICYIGYIVAAFHSKRQTFADMMMSTIVVTG